MDISERLECIAKMVEKCDSVADIGTDHAYLPIYLIKNGVCRRAIASDINKGPVEKAKLNIRMENEDESIECRLGPGLTTILPNEVNVAIIAGMGGNLIRDIIEDSMEVFKSLDYLVLQPVQNPDILRRYIYERGYEVIDEELCKDENRYYELIKIRYGNKTEHLEDIYCEISKLLLEKKHPIVKEYIFLKIKKYDTILNNIRDNGEMAKVRKDSLNEKIVKLKEMLRWL
jgi:tRNA (adenine22-N1)-methyltransferase